MRDEAPGEGRPTRRKWTRYGAAIGGGLFGEYPGLRDAVPEGEQLFDRQRVADIGTGEV